MIHNLVSVEAAYIIHEYIQPDHTYIHTRNVALPHPTTPTQPTYIHTYTHTYIHTFIHTQLLSRSKRAILKTIRKQIRLLSPDVPINAISYALFTHLQARTQHESGLGGRRSHLALVYTHMLQKCSFGSTWHSHWH